MNRTNAGKIAKMALKDNPTLREAAVKPALLTSEQFGEWVVPEHVVGQ